MQSFIHEQSQMRVVFGAGKFQNLASEVERLSLKHPLILTSTRRPKRAEEARGLLGAATAGIFAGAAMHVPAESVKAACSAVRQTEADGCIAIGGGSTTGLAKAIAHELGLPILAIPTTFAGSEMTPIYGITDAGSKRTGRDSRVLPRTVIYDPVLGMDVPVRVAAISGINALAHCFAGIIDVEASPISRMFAEEARRILMAALPRIVSEPESIDVRGEALYASWLAGSVLASVRLNVHYRICHLLGGGYNLPHAETHAAVLPHSVAVITGSAAAGREVYDLVVKLGGSVSLRELGLPAEAVPRAAQQLNDVMAAEIVRRAYGGEVPE